MRYSKFCCVYQLVQVPPLENMCPPHTKRL